MTTMTVSLVYFNVLIVIFSERSNVDLNSTRWSQSEAHIIALRYGCILAVEYIWLSLDRCDKTEELEYGCG